MNLRASALPLLAWGFCLVAAAPVLGAAVHAPTTDRVIVQWRGATTQPLGARPAHIEGLRARNARSIHRSWNIGGSLSVLQLERAQSGAELASTLAALRDDPDIALAVPDARVKARYVPNDTLYPAQWYLQSTQVAAIRANQAWDVTRGASSVVVAVLDTGVRFDHPDLAGKLLQGWDFVSVAEVGGDGDGWDADASDPGDFMSAADLASEFFREGECGGGPNEDEPTTSSWHGTRVSGLIAAASDNGVGLAGVGFNVRVLPVRVLGKCGGYVSDVIAGMYWAAGMSPPPPYMSTPIPPINTNPARILNLSLGADTPCTDETSEVYRVAVQQITANGTLVVAAAGNSGAEVGSPAGCAGVLAVAGLRHAGTKVGYSSLGAAVDIAAPAGNCVNAGIGDPCLFALDSPMNFGLQDPENSGYSSTTIQPTYGTSFSSPLAAGTAALMLSVNPDLRPAQVIELIRSTARPFPTLSDSSPQPPACVDPSVQPLQNAECICNTAVCGAGMLDAHAAVLAAQGATPAPPEPESGGGGQSGSLLPGLLLLWLARRRAPAEQELKR